MDRATLLLACTLATADAGVLSHVSTALRSRDEAHQCPPPSTLQGPLSKLAFNFLHHTVHRGDGSFDYNCDGVQTKQHPSPGSTSDCLGSAPPPSACTTGWVLDGAGAYYTGTPTAMGVSAGFSTPPVPACGGSGLLSVASSCTCGLWPVSMFQHSFMSATPTTQACR